MTLLFLSAFNRVCRTLKCCSINMQIIDFYESFIRSQYRLYWRCFAGTGESLGRKTAGQSSTTSLARDLQSRRICSMTLTIDIF